MKITREEGFEPVVITLESLEELNYLERCMITYSRQFINVSIFGEEANFIKQLKYKLVKASVDSKLGV